MRRFVHLKDAEVQLTDQESAFLFRKAPIVVLDMGDIYNYDHDEYELDILIKRVVIRDTVLTESGRPHTIDHDITALVSLPAIKDTVEEHIMAAGEEFEA